MSDTAGTNNESDLSFNMNDVSQVPNSSDMRLNQTDTLLQIFHLKKLE